MRARAAAASIIVYAAITVILGRAVIDELATAIANDAGDPLLTAAILHWNAHHVPLSDAWWQLPIFHPTRDAMAFSEHLLGVSLIASPLAWITGSPLAAYNITLLLMFPLAAIAMYALVYRLSGSAAGAFVAGLAFAFAPYRMATLSHIQILAVCWAPLALLGLHEYVDKRHWRWLILYGAAWMLQVASNLYTLVLFTLLVGLWVVWFVIARRDWRALGAIAAATVAASLPLAPVLSTYAAVHATHGFERNLGEMQVFSADLAAPFCAPATLTFWGWVRVACRGEGELFPGAVIVALFAVALLVTLRTRDPHRASRALTWAVRLLGAVAMAYAVVVTMFLMWGPFGLDAGPLRVSVSSLDKPLLIGLAAAIAALLLPLAVRATSLSSTLAFYLFAAITTWLLTLGPTVTVMGTLTGRSGPFALIAWLPGASSLRVPARFWLMTMLCLAVVAGLVVARVAKGKSRPRAAALTLAFACGVLADGWMAGIPVHPPPSALRDAAALRGKTVLQLPVEPYSDIAATWRAVMGGWNAVNGYSGNAPNYYAALTAASRLEDDALFAAFRRDRDLHVVVTGEGAIRQYRLPRQALPAAAGSGAPVSIAAVRSPCMARDLALLRDGDARTQWACSPDEGRQEITIDLGAPRTVGAVMYGLGRYYWEFTTHMAVETSLDGGSWSEARRGGILGDVIGAGLAEPRTLRVMLPFAPREARYIRVRPIDQKKDFRWSIVEVEVWGGTVASDKGQGPSEK